MEPICMKCRKEFKPQFQGQRVCRVCKQGERRSFCRGRKVTSSFRGSTGSKSNGSGHEH